VVLLCGVDAGQAQSILERCCKEVESRSFPQVGRVTISIGFACLELGSHPVDMLSNADKALYFAKNHGRNQVSSYVELLKNGLLEEIETRQGDVEFWS